MKRLKKTGAAWAAFAARVWPVLLRGLALYLDDVLLLGAGVCFVLAASELGRMAALFVAGVCCSGYAVMIARARRRGVR